MVPARILIAAENASTRLGGEAILPYHYFRLLRARGHDVHLIVHARMRPELEQLFGPDGRGGTPGVDPRSSEGGSLGLQPQEQSQPAHRGFSPGEPESRLHFVPDQLLQKFFYKLGRLLPRRIDEATFGLANQLLTQHAQRAVIRRLAVPGTVLHQPIPVSPRFPSLLSGLGAPLVVGPLNGGMEYPPAFRTAESVLTRTLIALGRTFTDTINAIFPGKRNAALVLVANARTRAALPSRLKGRIVELVENGVDTSQWSSTPAEIGPPRFLFIGRLVEWKALDIALEALTHVPGATLDVLGDGPLRDTWQSHATAIGANATFHGWKSQTDCAALLAGATALLLPSVYECGGAVVLESMAAAVPVIATAWGGPLDYLDPTCGYLIPPTSREALIIGFTGAMQTLAADPTLRAEMGKQARTRALAHFAWDHKITQIEALYQSLAT